MSSDEASSEPEQAPLLPDYIPGPEYLKYLAPYNVEIPIEDQPHAVDASPIALSPAYIADFDPEDESQDGPMDYPADGRDDDDSSGDDANDEDEEEEKEEDHLVSANSSDVASPDVDPVPSLEG
ncbi:hypothetical protein Tco_0294670 [Tanacetum coccineum]